MLLQLETIVLFVQNVDLLKGFYVDIFGFDIIEESDDQWVLLKAGACNIGLHKIGQEYIEENQEPFKFDNNTKIVFAFDGDIHVLRQELLSKNVTLREVMSWEGYPYLLCDGEDPEGNVFQLKTGK
jgi:catechol 2,3-dioxygenase-like lactoylglutathione lyase family enzyme